MSSYPFCHICDRMISRGDVYAKKGPWSYFQCPGCGLVLLHPVPDEATLNAFYNHSYEVNFDRYVKGVRRRSRAVLDDLKKSFPNRGRMLKLVARTAASLRRPDATGGM